jgi:hypothetical protein
MRNRVQCPDAKAEGYISDFPYNTEQASSQGVTFHVWLGNADPTPELLLRLERTANDQRDVVRFTYSNGAPTGFWAHEDFGAFAA